MDAVASGCASRARSVELSICGMPFLQRDSNATSAKRRKLTGESISHPATSGWLAISALTQSRNALILGRSAVAGR